MKFTVILATSMVCLMLICACQPESSTSGNKAVMDVSKPTAIVIKHNSGMYTIADGKSKFKALLTIGEQVYTTGSTDKAIQGTDGEREYVSIRRSDNTEGWVRPIYIANGATAGVIKGENAVLYSQPKNTNPTTASLPAKMVVAVSIDAATKPFYKIAAFDTVKGVAIDNLYIRDDSVSTSVDDTQSAVLLMIAMATENKDQRNALLTSAIKDYPRSFLSEEINGLLNGTTTTLLSVAYEVFNATMTINDNDVNVRSLPDANAPSLGKLSKNESITIVERSASQATIAGKSSHWYRISLPAEGWVFGTFIEGAD